MFHVQNSKKWKRKVASLVLVGSMVASLLQMDGVSYAKEQANEGNHDQPPVK